MLLISLSICLRLDLEKMRESKRICLQHFLIFFYSRSSKRTVFLILLPDTSAHSPSQLINGRSKVDLQQMVDADVPSVIGYSHLNYICFCFSEICNLFSYQCPFVLEITSKLPGSVVVASALWPPFARTIKYNRRIQCYAQILLIRMNKLKWCSPLTCVALLDYKRIGAWAVEARAVSFMVQLDEVLRLQWSKIKHGYNISFQGNPK